MARPRSFEEHAVVEAAKNAFSERGYDSTSIGDIEEVTGLSRSSLYSAFGTKRALLEKALADYVDSFVDPLLAPVERPGAGLREAASFFTALARLFRDPRSQRGCLMINTIGELAGRDPKFTSEAACYVNRYRDAFAHALTEEVGRGVMDRRAASRRADWLAATTVGVWIVVRADRVLAVSQCKAVAAEIKSWAAQAAPAPS